MSIFPSWDTQEFSFMTVDDFGQKKVDRIDNLPDFGFTFVLKRSTTHWVHSRSVYTILEFLGDVGGLKDCLLWLIYPFMSILMPSLLTRSILNNNFNYDNGENPNKMDSDLTLSDTNKIGNLTEFEVTRQSLLQNLRQGVSEI